jgi:hypothetical protein
MKYSIHCSRCKNSESVEFNEFTGSKLKQPENWRCIWSADYKNNNEAVNKREILCPGCMTHYHNVMKDFLGVKNEVS